MLINTLLLSNEQKGKVSELYAQQKVEMRNALDISSNAGSAVPDESNIYASNNGGEMSHKRAKS